MNDLLVNRVRRQLRHSGELRYAPCKPSQNGTRLELFMRSKYSFDPIWCRHSVRTAPGGFSAETSTLGDYRVGGRSGHGAVDGLRAGRPCCGQRQMITPRIAALTLVGVCQRRIRPPIAPEQKAE